MSSTSSMFRLLYLIRRLTEPYTYPTKEQLLEGLHQRGIATSARTLERDLQTLTNNYGLLVEYDRQNGGYWAHWPEDEDVEDFQTFLTLLERKERLGFLTASPQALLQASRLLLLDHQSDFPGNHWLPLLWDALQRNLVVELDYLPYEDSEAKFRRVEPALLVEDHQRWYLVGKDQKVNALRVYGIDRIESLQLTDELFQDSVREQYKTRKKHVIGMHIYEQEPVEVVLRVNPQESPYVLSSPLHTSQQKVKQTDHYTEVALNVVPNIELERAILAYGEAVEVIAPDSLREVITHRINKMREVYSE